MTIYNPPPQATTKRSTQVEEQVNRLDDTSEKLAAVVSMLVERLNSVTTETPQAGEPADDVEAIVPLAARLRGIQWSFAESLHDLSSVLDRLEL